MADLSAARRRAMRGAATPAHRAAPAAALPGALAALPSDRSAEEDPGFTLRYHDAGDALPGLRTLKPAIVAQLRLRRGLAVLELGCGPGEEARALARRVGGAGRVVGIDTSRSIVEEATRRARGFRLPVEFRVGDPRALDLPDASFDRVRVERLLMRIDGDPRRVLEEAVRVLRPGGRLVVFDLDWDTLVVEGAAREPTRRILHSFADGVRHGTIGRTLPRLLAGAGLTGVTVVPHGLAIPYDVFGWIVCGHLDRALAAGRFGAPELIEWWDELDRAHAAGAFFSAVLGFVVAGEKPDVAR